MEEIPAVVVDPLPDGLDQLNSDSDSKLLPKQDRRWSGGFYGSQKAKVSSESLEGLIGNRMASTIPLIKVAALCGSLRQGSYNLGLIRAAMELTKISVPGLEIEYVDISSLPVINTDLEVNGTYPPAVEDVRQKIQQADSILFASPEYNLSISAPLKNVIDWASRPPNCFADKPAAIVSAGGNNGGGRSQYHLRQVGVFLDLHFINKPEYALYLFQPPVKFDDENNLIDETARERLKEVLLSLQAFTLRLKAK